ncbi:MAG TPA: PAS domain S-box protein [Coleofasciculaceae cyanobacterium]
MYRILLIDDNPEDRLLILRELNREFSEIEVQEVIETEGFNQALNTGNFELVITDYQLRWNDGVTVLRDIKSCYPNCPVIMFTDSGDQEIAVEAMKAGLDDYIVKSPKHYIRLPIAVRQVLQQAESRRTTERLEMRLQTLLNRLNVGVFRSTLDGCLLEGNASFLRLLGVSSLEDAQTLDLHELFRQPELERSNQEREVQLHRADGSSLWVLLNQTISTTDAEPIIEGLIEDISDRRRVQEALKQANEELEIRVAERTQALQQANEQLLKEMGEREEAQETLRESEERYRQLVELSPDAIFVNRGGTFMFVNNAAVKLFGATNSSDLIGKPIIERVHPDYREIVKTRIQQIVEQGKPTEWMEQKLVNLNGTAIDVEVAAVPFTYQHQSAVQVVIRDISDAVAAATQRKRAEAELKLALEKEREFSELKSRIITTISHEYRTPLTTILSSAEFLENYSHKLTEERKLKHLQRIQVSSKHLTKLVNDVLFFGQAEAEKLQFNPVPLNLEQFCQEIVEEIRSSNQNQTAITFLTRGNCTNACLDEKLLRQILANLLSNAIKYSPVREAEFTLEKTVKFEIECTEEIVRFRIQDKGIGIPADDLPQLFESFHRANNVGTIPGTGLGLAIVKQCVDLLEGQITVESAVDEGTTFIVTLPLHKLPVKD